MALAGVEVALEEQLLDRRRKLETALTASSGNDELLRLLNEVDSALTRMGNGTYGLCEVCKEPIETDRLLSDPLVRLCLDHLTETQARALEEDLELAARIQGGLLPENDQKIDGWEFSYHYEPHGLVSGDYCDFLASEDGQMHFIMGDVSGKGVSASMLMAHLHAMFQSLISVSLPLDQLISRASRIFCESTLPSHYATLVCGKASRSGEIEICNAGHLPPFVVQNGRATRIAATGLPLGVFCDESFSLQNVKFEPGNILTLFSDGLTETRNEAGIEYGMDRLEGVLTRESFSSASDVVGACLQDLKSFRGGRPGTDDLTIMAIRRC